MSSTLSANLTILIKFLLVPVLILASVLLYRLDRILASGVHSAEMLERTAENVEMTSRTVYDTTSLLRKIPFVGSDVKKEDE